MKIIHKFLFNSSIEIQQELREFGVSVSNSGIARFVFEEDHNLWPHIERWASMRQPLDFVHTKFSKREMLQADWYQMLPDWHDGYPQPDEQNFGYRNFTYDSKNYCDLCGIGLSQVGPFMMKCIPRWGKRSLVQLNWVFDQYFIKENIYNSFIKKYNVPILKVLGPGNNFLNDIFQIYLNENVEIDVANLAHKVCLRCNRSKFLFNGRGFFPNILGNPFDNMVRTAQYFGDGASAYKAVLVSKEIYMVLTENKIRGVSFIPLKN